MLYEDADALLCDMAEFYHIYDLRALPLKTTATLAAGLPARSRTKMRLTGCKADSTELLIAAAVDRLSLLVWSKTEDARQGVKKPKMLVEMLTGRGKESEKTASFGSPEEFMAAREEILKSAQKGGGAGG